MPRNHTAPAHLRKTLLALAVGTMLAPQAAWALNLVQAPPGTVQPYVTPNVIISVDDSGSMAYRLDKEGSTSDNVTTPLADGTWPVTRKRINVLKYALKSIFDPADPNYDNTLLPDKKIRLAWQVMHNNGKSNNADNVNNGEIATLDNGGIIFRFDRSMKPDNSTKQHKNITEVLQARSNGNKHRASHATSGARIFKHCQTFLYSQVVSLNYTKSSKPVKCF